jgi:hypothetical protein
MIGSIFQREFATKKEAAIFESKLKKLRNKQYICSNFHQFFISGCGLPSADRRPPRPAGRQSGSVSRWNREGR